MKNFLEYLTENELYIDYLKTALSNGLFPNLEWNLIIVVVKNINEDNEEKKSVKATKNLEIDTLASSPSVNKMLNHTKEFGNISSINMIETPQNLCASILENDCLLVKMLNDNANSRILENSISEKQKNGSNNNLPPKEKEFRKQKVEKQIFCPCNHEELLVKALNEISLLNNQIVNLKSENEVIIKNQLKHWFFGKTLRNVICNKENEEALSKRYKKGKSGYSVNPGKREETEANIYHKDYKGNTANNFNDEKNFIAKLQANLGLAPDKFKML